MCIQEETLRKISQLGGEGLLTQLISLFLKQCENRLQSLRTSLDEGNLRETARLAHSLISSSGSLGADTAMADARALETAAEAGDEPASAEAFQNLERSVNSATVRLAEIRDRLSPGG